MDGETNPQKKIKMSNDNIPPLSCGRQITLSKINEICQLATPNQISTISMHKLSLVKIHCNLLKLSSGNENMDGQMTNADYQHETITPCHDCVTRYKKCTQGKNLCQNMFKFSIKNMDMFMFCISIISSQQNSPWADQTAPYTILLEKLVKEIQWTLIISTSLISNNRLSGYENLLPVLTWKSNNRLQNIVRTRIPRKASSHLLAQKSQEPQSECGY